MATMAHGSDAFELLTSLVGDWTGQCPDGTTDTVSYAFTAGDTAIVESWILAGGKRAMTVYYMDAQDVMAAHYCPWGNFPRLQLETAKSPGKLVFRIVDGANLHVPGRLHQHAFSLQAITPDRFERSECYLPNDCHGTANTGAAMGDVAVYTRVTA